MRCQYGSSQHISQYRAPVVRPYLTLLCVLLLLGPLPLPWRRFDAGTDVSGRSVEDTASSTAIVAGGRLGLALAAHLDHQPASYSDDDDDGGGGGEWSSQHDAFSHNGISIVEKLPTVIVIHIPSYTIG